MKDSERNIQMVYEILFIPSYTAMHHMPRLYWWCAQSEVLHHTPTLSRSKLSLSPPPPTSMHSQDDDGDVDDDDDDDLDDDDDEACCDLRLLASPNLLVKKDLKMIKIFVGF
ncbi:hypothetical protein E2C01_036481 [Portunus trituberculatus]|uniref:Uncharacterized protein n=1 Tax=Portunus trituberculatus TaxID=210409 RepID=A0A5B7F5R9_PORTR|nr:hypothetical protein [Portunus trituberculatus]